MSLAAWFRGASVTEADVRSEIWRLGSRHHGWPLEGALEELAEKGVPDDRAALLRACVKKLRDEAPD
jgi:hypothetical protein